MSDMGFSKFMSFMYAFTFVFVMTTLTVYLAGKWLDNKRNKKE
jgi:hypothetical protein